MYIMVCWVKSVGPFTLIEWSDLINKVSFNWNSTAAAAAVFLQEESSLTWLEEVKVTVTLCVWLWWYTEAGLSGAATVSPVFAACGWDWTGWIEDTDWWLGLSTSSSPPSVLCWSFMGLTETRVSPPAQIPEKSSWSFLVPLVSVGMGNCLDWPLKTVGALVGFSAVSIWHFTAKYS